LILQVTICKPAVVYENPTQTVSNKKGIIFMHQLQVKNIIPKNYISNNHDCFPSKKTIMTV
jgi:hypothetical protein